MHIRFVLLLSVGVCGAAASACSGPDGGSSAADGDVPDGAATRRASADCEAADSAGCGPGDGRREPGGWRRIPGTDVCADAGYLCAGLSADQPVTIVHFAPTTEVLVVRLPAPGHEDGVAASRLRRAAVRGIQAWDGHPFPLRILDGDDPGPADVDVRWRRRIDDETLGRTDLRFRGGPSGSEYQVAGLVLATRVPRAPSRIADVDALRLTAAHEMGHALGLPHSDDERDLMYPRKTATHPSARDYRTLEALYRIPSGTRIVR